MDIRTQLSYDAPPAVVFDMLIDEEFLARKAMATGALSHQAEVSTFGEIIRIRLHRVLPPKVPDYARPFVGDRLDVVQLDEWQVAAADGTRSGTFIAEIRGVPASIHGALRLSLGNSGGTVETFTGQIRAGIPFVGRKIEQAAATAVLSAVEKEQQVGRAWLADRG